MENLNVPMFYQKKDYDCGAACVKMVLDFFGDKKPYKQILKEFKDIKNGLSLYDVGNFFLKHGYKVNILVWSDYFPGNFFRINSKYNRRNILRWAKRETNAPGNADAYKKEVAGFLKNGGELYIGALESADIRFRVKTGCPPIVSVCAGLLWALGGQKNIASADFLDDHFVVVRGIALNDSVLVNDPYKKRRNYFFYEMENFLLACHRSQEDFGAIFVRPKKAE